MDSMNYRRPEQKRILGLKPTQLAVLIGLGVVQMIIVIVLIVVLMSPGENNQGSATDNEPLPTAMSLKVQPVQGENALASEPTATPRPRVTSTPMPPPDLPGVLLSLSDMPPGFDNIDTGDAAFENSDTLHFFAYYDPANLQIVMGFAALVPSRIEQTLLDKSLNQDEVVEQLANSFLMGFDPGAIIIEQRQLRGMDNIGNASAGVTTLIESSTTQMRVDFVLLRRNAFEIMLFTFYPEQTIPQITIKDMAIKLDNRVNRMYPMEVYILPQPTPNPAEALATPYPPSPIYLNSLAISKFDLPVGFVEILPEESNLDLPLFAAFPTQYEYVAFNAEPFTVLWGGLGYIGDAQAQERFDQAIRRTDINWEQLFGDEGEGPSLTDHQPLADLGSVSDVGVGYSILTKNALLGLDLHYDVIMFRRGGLVAYVTLVYIEGETPPISIRSVINTLDARLQEAPTP